MNDIVVWIIIAAFYAPLHYLLPFLIVVLNADTAEQRKSGIRGAVISASISMLIAFLLVIWLVSNNSISLAMGILFFSMLVPLGQVIYLKQQWRS